MAEEKRTLYDLLGVFPQASSGEIECAYRDSVRGLQAAIDAGNPEALNELRLMREGHHILSDPAQRARYDSWALPAPQGAGAT